VVISLLTFVLCVLIIAGAVNGWAAVYGIVIVMIVIIGFFALFCLGAWMEI